MAVSADCPGFTAAPCQLAPSGTGTQNQACEEKVQDISSLARNSLSVKSHVPFLLSQEEGSQQPAHLTQTRSAGLTP